MLDEDVLYLVLSLLSMADLLRFSVVSVKCNSISKRKVVQVVFNTIKARHERNLEFNYSVNQNSTMIELQRLDELLDNLSYVAILQTRSDYRDEITNYDNYTRNNLTDCEPCFTPNENYICVCGVAFDSVQYPDHDITLTWIEKKIIFYGLRCWCCAFEVSLTKKYCQHDHVSHSSSYFRCSNWYSGYCCPSCSLEEDNMMGV